MGILKDTIESKKIDITTIAKKLFISRSTIYRIDENIENAKFGDVVKLCNFLKISPFKLLPNGFECEDDYNAIKNLKRIAINEISNKFTNNEKKYLADMLNSTLINYDIDQKTLLKLNIIDVDIYEHLGNKWGVNPIDLVKKIDEVSSFQAFSMVVIIKEWWNNEERDLENIFWGD